MLAKIKKAVKHPELIMLRLFNSRFARTIPDSVILKIQFRLRIGKKLNLKKPITFNEKLQWLKLHERDPLYIKMVDKYEVKKIIEDTIGKEFVIPLLGVWDKFEDIDFDKLPDQFVLKCTHDSGGVIICMNKSQLDISAARKKIESCLKRNYYYSEREWPYKNVKPKIICEEYKFNASGEDIKDYKFMCFNGKVKCAFVCLNRSVSLNVDFYDTDWNRMPFERHYPRGNTLVPKPVNLELMIQLSEKLAEGIPFVRIDFYEIDNKVYFGEITFFPGSGYEEFTPEKFDAVLGSWIALPQQERK